MKIKTVNMMKNKLLLLIVAFGFNNCVKAQSRDISFQEIKNNVNVISKSFCETKETPFDYLTITLEDDGNRWMYLSWKRLDGLSSTEKNTSMKTAISLLNAVHESYNYLKEYPIDKKQFINAMRDKKIVGIKTNTRNNIFFFSWRELRSKGYL